MRAFDSCKGCKHRKQGEEKAILIRVAEICVACKRCYVRGSKFGKTFEDLYKSE